MSFIDPGAVAPLKVVVDGGNGMAGVMVGPLLERLPLELIETYWVPDGEFPDHEPNPLLPENRQFVIDRVLDEGADLGIAWDGDADRCFFIDDNGEFVDGDFLTALLSKLVLAKTPGASILYDVRASRAVPDTVSAAGGTPHINRVGHAFFKIAMREHDGEFGGEVSGHYYFRKFWSADSGTVPALLLLELLSREGSSLSELVGSYRDALLHLRRDQLRGRRPGGEDEGDRRLPSRRRDRLARRRLGRLSRLALQRPPVEHRAAPAPQPRVARLARGHGAKARRGARADPRLTPEEALERAASEGIHRLRIPTPFAVGRVNCYLIEDSPLTLVDTGPNSGKSLDELQQQLAAAGHGIEDLELIVITHQHIDHLGLVEILAARSGADVAAIDLLVPFAEAYDEGTAADDEFAGGLMLRYGIPEDLIVALRSVSSSFRAWGAAANVTRPLADGSTLELEDRTFEVQHRPGHSPTDTVFWDAERRMMLCADHLIAHISSNPLLSRPLDGSTQRPKALVTYLDSLAKTRAPAGRDPAPRPRRADHRSRRADRRPLRDAPPAGREAPPPDRAEAADGVRARAGAVGQRRRHPGVPDPVGDRRPRRPADRLRPRPRGRRRRSRPLRGDAARRGEVRIPA